VDALGIDIGGTKIAAALVSPDGNVTTVLSRPTTADDPERIIASVAELVEELSGPHVLDIVGVAAAAFLDRGRDNVYLAPNISWTNFPLRARLVDALDRPVLLENDANAAGWAEFQFGAARTAESMIMLTIGTGVGGAIVESGKLLLGGFWSGGRIGTPHHRAWWQALRVWHARVSGAIRLRNRLGKRSASTPGARRRELRRVDGTFRTR